jgi:ribosomal protein L14E/L6E/L27E
MKVIIPVPGGICKSTQGRDKGRYYLIKIVNQDGTVCVVDGNYKKLASPKKKNIRHLQLLPDTAEAIAAKLADGRQIFDTEVYSALKSYNVPRNTSVEEEGSADQNDADPLE